MAVGYNQLQFTFSLTCFMSVLILSGLKSVVICISITSLPMSVLFSWNKTMWTVIWHVATKRKTRHWDRICANTGNNISIMISRLCLESKWSQLTLQWNPQYLVLLCEHLNLHDAHAHYWLIIYSPFFWAVHNELHLQCHKINRSSIMFSI
jgi:hypothetical protein